MSGAYGAETHKDLADATNCSSHMTEYTIPLYQQPPPYVEHTSSGVAPAEEVPAYQNAATGATDSWGEQGSWEERPSWDETPQWTERPAWDERAAWPERRAKPPRAPEKPPVKV